MGKECTTNVFTIEDMIEKKDWLETLMFLAKLKRKE